MFSEIKKITYKKEIPPFGTNDRFLQKSVIGTEGRNLSLTKFNSLFFENYLVMSMSKGQSIMTFNSPENEYIALDEALLIEMIVEKMPARRKRIYQFRQ